jgi:hypothetical protein
MYLNLVFDNFEGNHKAHSIIYLFLIFLNIGHQIVILELSDYHLDLCNDLLRVFFKLNLNNFNTH